MVRVHVKHGGSSDGDGEFLYDTETTSTIDEIAKDIIEIANFQSKIQCFAVELESRLSQFQGDPKVMPLVRALSEATSDASKDQVIHNKPLSLYVLRDHTRNIEKEFLVTYSVMGLSNSDLQQFLSDLQILEENTVQLLWAGKELTRGKKLCDFIGRNEKTKVQYFFSLLHRNISVHLTLYRLVADRNQAAVTYSTSCITFWWRKILK